MIFAHCNWNKRGQQTTNCRINSVGGMMMKELAIIGFGRFGQLAAKHLKEQFSVFVADKLNKQKEADTLNVKFVDKKTAAQKPIIILAVPVQQLEETLKEISKNILPGTLVLDVCSVKMLPVQL